MAESPRQRRRRLDQRRPHLSVSFLALQRELHGRFVSRGGRPADSAPTIRRLVTIKKEVWKRLKHHAAVLSRTGRRISPGQLAAMMLERAVADVGPGGA